MDLLSSISGSGFTLMKESMNEVLDRNSSSSRTFAQKYRKYPIQGVKETFSHQQLSNNRAQFCGSICHVPANGGETRFESRFQGNSGMKCNVPQCLAIMKMSTYHPDHLCPLMSRD